MEMEKLHNGLLKSWMDPNRNEADNKDCMFDYLLRTGATSARLDESLYTMGKSAQTIFL